MSCVPTMFTGTVVLYTYEQFSVEMSSYSKGQGVPELALLAFKKFLSTFFRLDPPNKFMCMCAHMCTGEAGNPLRSQRREESCSASPPPTSTFTTKERVTWVPLPLLFQRTSILIKVCSCLRDMCCFSCPTSWSSDLCAGTTCHAAQRSPV